MLRKPAELGADGLSLVPARAEQAHLDAVEDEGSEAGGEGGGDGGAGAVAEGGVPARACASHCASAGEGREDLDVVAGEGEVDLAGAADVGVGGARGVGGADAEGAAVRGGVGVAQVLARAAVAGAAEEEDAPAHGVGDGAVQVCARALVAWGLEGPGHAYYVHAAADGCADRLAGWLVVGCGLRWFSGRCE